MRKVSLTRDGIIEAGYDASEFVGDVSLAYSPLLVFIIMAMATVSISIMGALATNWIFSLAWGICTAFCVDGLTLGIWLRVRSFKWDTPSKLWYMRLATGARYAATLSIAVFMFIVAVSMSILISYQQVQGVSNELLAMRNLSIDPLWFIFARGLLVTLCATLAIFFRAEKAETISKQRKARATQDTKVTVIDTTARQLPEHAGDMLQDMNRSPQYIAIRDTMVTLVVDGRISHSLKAISELSSVPYPTVKKWASTIKEELGVSE